MSELGVILFVIVGLYFVDKISKFINQSYNVSILKSEKNRIDEASQKIKAEKHKAEMLDRFKDMVYFEVTGIARLYEKQNMNSDNDFYWFFDEIELVTFQGLIIPHRIKKWNKNWYVSFNPVQYVSVEGPRKVKIPMGAFPGMVNSPFPEEIIFFRDQFYGILGKWKPFKDNIGHIYCYYSQINKTDNPEFRI